MNESSRRLSRTAWVLLLIAGVPLLSCGGCLTWWIGRGRIASAELRQKVDQRKLAGLPYNNDSLDVFYRQQTSDRLTDRWLDVIATLSSQSFTGSTQNVPVVGLGPDIPPLEQPWAEQAMVESFLQQHDRVLQEILALGKESEAVRFPIVFDSMNTLLEQAQTIRSAARLLMLQRRVSQRKGDTTAEYDAINALIGCSLTLRGDPIIVSQLVSIAVHGIAISELQDAVERNSLSAEQLASLAKRLETFEDFRTPYQRALQGEIGMALPIIENPTGLNELQEGPPLPTFLNRSRDALTYIEWMEKAATQENTNLQEFSNQAKQWQDDLEAIFEEAGLLTKFDTMTTMLVMPAMGAYGNAQVRHVLNNRLALLGIAVRRYQLQNGSLPSELSVLVGDFIAPATMESDSAAKFGYRVSDNLTHLWGYDVTQAQLNRGSGTILSEPPAKNNDPENDVHEWWIWELKP
jgi:hypothetical protein